MWTFHTHSNPGPTHQTGKKRSSVCREAPVRINRRSTQRRGIKLDYLVVVGFIREELWTHVVRGSYECAGHIILVLQYSCDAKVSNFDDVGLCQEDVLCFKIPVKNISLMQVLKSTFKTVTSDGLSAFKENKTMPGPDFQSHSIPEEPWLSGQTTPPPASQVGVHPSAV